MPSMLAVRSLAFSQLRSFTYSASLGRMLSRNDVEVLTNPSGKYMDAFMESHGQHRTVFKKSDISLWHTSFGEDYQLRLLCLKGTTKVIATSQMNVFRPIDPLEPPAYFIGMGWAAPEMRKHGVAALLGDMVLENVATESNIVSHMNQNARQFWSLLTDKKESAEEGHEAMDAGFISFYDAKDVALPSDLYFDGIIVKDVRDASKIDMINYDQKIHPYHRERYIVAHMHDKDGFGKVAYDQEGAVIGMAQAVIYPKGDCNLGPVYGDNPRVVQAMFADILKDIAASGRTVTRFEVRSNQMCSGSFKWIKPFLKCELSREHVCNLVYRHTPPKNIDFSKVYCPTHAQLFLV